MQTETSNASTSLFTQGELAFLKSQQICRIATANAKGEPHVTPMSFYYDAATNTFVISGHGGFANRKKWRDVGENPHVALVFDAILSYDPWTAAGIEIRGVAVRMATGGEVLGQGFDADCFIVTPKRIISWGIEGNVFGPPHARSVNQ